jgi:S-adenosylmethionine:tRNA ribosyltransferase-isomerase
MAEVILHVGFGTFLPIRDEDVTGHRMEPEYYEIDHQNADLINSARRLIVVGTTTFKALQTSARGGGEVTARREFSDLFIYPGVDLPLKVDGLITNFHLPKSTLLLLVSAYLSRERVLKAYREAVERRYRFFSLGDATFLLKQP